MQLWHLLSARVVGTAAVVVGAAVMVLEWNTPGRADGYLVGALFVVGGLLLRIEAAIRERDRVR